MVFQPKKQQQQQQQNNNNPEVQETKRAALD
jgi:hypothetical protein